jgi:cytochrome c oxidase cbb3-type subunit 3
MSYRLLVRTVAVLFVGLSNQVDAQGNSPAAETRRSASVEEAFSLEGYIRQGQQNFRVWCSRCHGRNARGGKGPDLTDANQRHVTTDAEILLAISDGIPGTGMPGFGEGFEEWLRPIVAYLRAEQKQRSREVQPPPGDIARGYELFKQHKCSSCHWTGQEGGRLGTDLSRLTATTDYVRQSLSEPDSQIDGSYQSVQIVMDDGRVLGGRRLNENTYYLLLMDEQQNLLALPKSQIDELIKPHKSLMPSFTKQLGPEDAADLSAYIFSLQKEREK